MNWLKDKATIVGLLGATGVLSIGAMVLGLSLMDVKGDLRDMTAQRNTLVAWAEKACLTVGRPFGAKGGAEACLTEITRLVSFERDTDRETAALLERATAEANQKQSADRVAANKAAKAAEQAARKMEKANAAVPETNDVGSDFFGALNELAGLRGPQ